MAYTISDREIGVSLNYYVKQSNIMTSIIRKEGLHRIEDYADFIYLIVDPRSNYFDIALKPETRIQLILEDYPRYGDCLESDSFDIVFNYINRLYSSEVKDNLVAYMDLLSDYKKRLVQLKNMINDLQLNADLLKSVTAIEKSFVNLVDLQNKYKAALEEYINYVRDIETDVGNKDLSILEKLKMK